MNKQILEFRKTDHFLFSQWDRSIDDQLLYKVLPFVECTKCCKDVIIVKPSFLKNRDIKARKNDCLIVIATYNVLITTYWCNHPDYLYNKEKNAHFQILN